MRRKKIALGCPTNDVLGFCIHFHLLIFGCFGGKWSFSTATRFYVNNLPVLPPTLRVSLTCPVLTDVRFLPVIKPYALALQDHVETRWWLNGWYGAGGRLHRFLRQLALLPVCAEELPSYRWEWLKPIPRAGKPSRTIVSQRSLGAAGWVWSTKPKT
jgi:hypothetical protein